MREPIPGADLLAPLIDEAALAALEIDSPRLLGLFEGYGGLTMGTTAVTGGTLAAYAEIDPSSIRLLEHHYPGIPNLGDVTAVDFSAYRGAVDGIVAGFPCQDVSAAGLGKGLQAGTRSGLWSEVARAVLEIGPRFVLIENVRGLRSAPAGLTGDPELLERLNDDEGTTLDDLESDAWDLGGSGGGDRPLLRALGAVLGDLADLGFDAEWTSVRASMVGAAHRRERVFILGYPAP